MTLDVEATCLPVRSQPQASRPIEVGLAEIVTGDQWSWLIRPPVAWKASWQWSAEGVHGISLAELERDGHDLDEVRARLQDATADRIVLSDNPGYDRYWLHSLYVGPPPFEIHDVDTAIGGILGHISHDERLRVYLAEQLSAVRFPLQHRAGPDARRLAEFVRLIAGISEAPAAPTSSSDGSNAASSNRIAGPPLAESTP